MIFPIVSKLFLMFATDLGLKKKTGVSSSLLYQTFFHGFFAAYEMCICV